MQPLRTKHTSFFRLPCLHVTSFTRHNRLTDRSSRCGTDYQDPDRTRRQRNRFRLVPRFGQNTEVREKDEQAEKASKRLVASLNLFVQKCQGSEWFLLQPGHCCNRESYLCYFCFTQCSPVTAVWRKPTMLKTLQLTCSAHFYDLQQLAFIWQCNLKL